MRDEEEYLSYNSCFASCFGKFEYFCAFLIINLHHYEKSIVFTIVYTGCGIRAGASSDQPLLGAVYRQGQLALIHRQS